MNTIFGYIIRSLLICNLNMSLGIFNRVNFLIVNSNLLSLPFYFSFDYISKEDVVRYNQDVYFQSSIFMLTE